MNQIALMLRGMSKSKWANVYEHTLILAQAADLIEKSEVVREKASKLVSYMAGDGFSRFGFDGDCRDELPEECAVRWLREFDALLMTDAGRKAYTAMLQQRLIDAGLVPHQPGCWTLQSPSGHGVCNCSTPSGSGDANV